MSPPGPSFTDKQGQYLAFIDAYTRVHGRAPAEADMQRHFGVTPPSVHQMVLTLERAGLIRRQPGLARSIQVLVDPDRLPRLRPPQTVITTAPRNWWVIFYEVWHSSAPAERLRFRSLCVQATEPPSRWIGSP
jgi:SOS-response transcriptional repressor LexA